MRQGQVFQKFQSILIVCPRCGLIHRLSELKLSYRGKLRRTWLDDLEMREEKQKATEERFEERKEEIKEKEREKGRRQLPGRLKKCAPVLCSRGYFPQDVKALFDPVDFIVFDGMNQKQNVKRVVLLDGPPFDKRRERTQESIKKVIRKGDYEWQTVKIDDTTGRIAE